MAYVALRGAGAREVLDSGLQAGLAGPAMRFLRDRVVNAVLVGASRLVRANVHDTYLLVGPPDDLAYWAGFVNTQATEVVDRG